MTVYINGTTGYSGPVGTIGDLTTTGNTTLGDASGDTLTINGSTTTLTQGTANGVAYLNGSKVLTTGTALVFDGTNLGVGTTSPANLLHINGSNSVARFSGANTALAVYQTFYNNSTAQVYFGIESSSGTGIIGTGAAYGMVLSTASTSPLVFGTNGTERMRLDSSGNLGLGVTPSSWNTITPLQIKNASFGGYITGTTYNSYVGSNWYYNSGDKYIGNGFASVYVQSTGQHLWYTAASGTAGNAISFTQAMTLTASNQLLIGTTSSAQAFELVNNQNAVTRARITNTSTGTGAIAEWSSYNGSNQTTVAMYGTNTTSSGVLTPSTGYLFTDSSSLSLVVSGTSGVIKFGSGAGFGEIARFTSAGNLVLAGGTTSANGIGVTFPASQSASTDANCLDDYEEGTWTPSYFGTSSNPTVSYSKQVGRYVKIGRMVYWGLAVVVSTTSGGSGTLYINGPFTSLSTGANTWGGLSTWNGGGTFSGQQPSDFALINGTNNMYLHTRSTTGASSDVPVSALLNGSNIEAFGMYEV